MDSIRLTLYKGGIIIAVWEIEYTDEFGAWWGDLSVAEQASVAAVVEELERRGPALRRPFVAPIATSRFANMKELIPPGGAIRVLFAFDPRRTAVLLIGGDKSGRWNEWYREFIPVADSLYAEHLGEIEGEAID